MRGGTEEGGGATSSTWRCASARVRTVRTALRSAAVACRPIAERVADGCRASAAATGQLADGPRWRSPNAVGMKAPLHSAYPTYEKMWSFMSKHPDVFVSSNQEGIEKVRSSNGKYAYLIESTTNEYVNSRQPCDTMKVGANLNSRGYGFGMPQDSDLRHRINIAILLLRERGVLDELEKKWWHQIGDICPRSATDSAASANELTLPQIAGIFYILAAGLALSLLIACLEVAARAKIDAYKSEGAMSFLEAFKIHLRLFARGPNAGDKGSSAPSLAPSESGNQRKSPVSRQESTSQHLAVTSLPPPPPRFGNAPPPQT